MIERELEGQPLAPGASFTFACRPGLACFNTCCANKRLPVLPYDLLRLRQALGLPSQEILARYLTLEEDPVSGWPALRLELTDMGRCPLLGEAGCTVYDHRPAACRLYPLSRAVARGFGGQAGREVFLRLTTQGCLGWEEDNTLTVGQWILDQGLPPYLAANDRLLSLLLHTARQGKLRLNERQTHGVILALYNLDLLRPLMERPAFASGLAPELRERARQDDQALLDWGQAWLARQFFGD